MRALVPLLLSRRRPDALIAHMCPIYLVLAAPLAKIVRMPLGMWYTHWAIDWELRVATALADVALSVDRRSYPIDRPKVLGSATASTSRSSRRATRRRAGNGTLRLLALGRTSPSKGFATLVRACGRARREGLELRVDDPRRVDDRRGAAASRRARGADRGRGPERRRVGRASAVPRPRVPELVRAVDAVVNTTWSQPAGGALDKVVYEAAACGVPVLACNPYFDQFLGDLPLDLLFASDNDADLARVLHEFAQADTDSREAAGRELRRRVETGHSIDSWADAVVATVRRLHD